MKGLGISIEVNEISNGVVVKYFSMQGSSALDRTVHYESFDSALKGIGDWLKELVGAKESAEKNETE